MTVADKLARAAASEQRALDRLLEAAAEWSEQQVSTDAATSEIKSAAKAWTNAYHQTSRCRKHVKDGAK